MGLSSTTSRWIYTGNDSTDTFAFSAKILAASDLVVTKRLISTGAETTLVLNTDYTVTGIGLNAGGSITLDDGALPSTYRIVIRRVRPLTQETDIRNQLDFYPEIHEDKFDELTMIHQQQQDQLDRSVALPETLTDADFDPALPAEIAGASGQALVTNPSGTGWILADVATLINITGALAQDSNLSDVTDPAAAFNNISGMSLLGDLIYGGIAGIRSILAGNTAASKKFLSQTGTGTASAAPSWSSLSSSDVGLGNVDNTSDATKNAAVATLTNKTLTDAVLNKILSTEQSSTPATPASGTTLVYSKTDGKVYKLSSDGVETEIGSGSGGGVNFITNGSAESGTVGWATYADAAGALPVDATGGSPTVTWTRTTSTPLTGTGSFLFTKDASDRQGEGASYQFSIDNASALFPKVQQIEFDYQVASGTFASGSSDVDSDLEIYIVDNDGAVIQPTTYKLYGQGGHFSANFQNTYNVTSYRLVFHCATTSADAYSVKFDSISVAPSKYTYGTPITDWVSYTPTFTGFGTAANISFYSRRVGDSLEVQGVFQAGTATATQARITLGYGGVNGNVVADTSKNAGIVGHGESNAPSTTDFRGFNVLINNANYLTFSQENSTSGYSGTGANGSAMASTSAFISFFAKVSIVGWSSNIQMSDSAPQSDVGGMASGASQTFANGGSDLQITTALATVSNDLNGAWDGAGVYTAKVPGNYLVLPRIGFSSAPTGLISLKYKLNSGSTVALAAYTTPPQYTQISGQLFINLKSGDTLKFYVNNATATNPITTDLASVVVIRLGGNQTIAATETVAARYSSSAGQSIPASTETVVVFGTEDDDTHGAFNSSTGVFTAPYPGRYTVRASVFWSLTPTGAGNAFYMELYKNGTSFSRLATRTALTTGAQDVHLVGGDDDVYLKAGETLSIAVFQGTTAAKALVATASLNYVSLHRIGL